MTSSTSSSTSGARRDGVQQAVQVTSDLMVPCDDAHLFSAAAYTPTEAAANKAAIDGELSDAVAGDAAAYQLTPTAGLPAPSELTLGGLLPPAGSGTRRYSLYNRKPCSTLPPGHMAGADDSAAASAWGDSSTGSTDVVASDSSPAAGSAVCLINREQGQFECASDNGRTSTLVSSIRAFHSCCIAVLLASSRCPVE